MNFFKTAKNTEKETDTVSKAKKMKLSEAASKYVFTTQINLDEDGGYLILRELNMQESKELEAINTDDVTKMISKLEQFFPGCVLESSFVSDDDTPASGKEIYEELKMSGSLMTEVLTTWLQSIPFQSRLGKKEK
jgi:hypothetical protein